jgi:hypothetical protein
MGKKARKKKQMQLQLKLLRHHSPDPVPPDKQCNRDLGNGIICRNFGAEIFGPGEWCDACSRSPFG